MFFLNVLSISKLSYFLLYSGKRLCAQCLLALALTPALLLPFEQVVWASDPAASVSFKKNIHSSESRVSSRESKAELSVQARTWQAYQLSHSAQLARSPLTQLPVLADGQSALPSNANNFHGAWNATVDSRTGNASFTLTAASTLYDLGQGKRDLTLSYSGGPSAQGPDPLGLGPHWTFNVGTEHPSTSEVAGHQTTDITTGDGHSFTMESDCNDQGQTVWHPLRHKLGDVVITGRPGDWIIAMATGVREHLLDGFEDWEESRDGQRVWFYYDRNGPADVTRHLAYVCAKPLTQAEVSGPVNACKDNGTWITYRSNEVTIHGQQTVVLHQGTTGGIDNIDAITLPSLSSVGISNHAENGVIQLRYDELGNRPWLLHSVTYPGGENTTFLYNGESDRVTPQSQGLPVGMNQAHIPVVTEEITTPPRALAGVVHSQRLWYQYGLVGADQHNYTGYQSGASMAPGQDNLLDRADNYTYQVTQDNGLSATTTVYNKYHLPLTVVQRDDQQHSLLAKSEQQYAPWKDTTFARLPATYSLLQQATKTLYGLDEQGQDAALMPAKVLQNKRYDHNGQVIWQRDAYGRETFTQYCPAGGDAHCPATDAGWPEVTLPEKVLQVPAGHSPAGSVPYLNLAATTDSAPVVEVVLDYTRLPVAQKYLQQARTDRVVTKMLNSPATLGFWQVSTKTVGTLTAQVSGLKPGSVLPELPAGQVTTETRYKYNQQQSSPTYGQLTQIAVTKRPGKAPVVKGTLLNLAAGAVPVSAQDTVTVNVVHSINANSHQRTTVMTVVPKTTPTDIKGLATLLQQGGEGLSLGTAVYSLVSGVKLASEDTLKTQHTHWTYDLWNRPVKEVVTPTDGGQPRTITWTYIMTGQETAVVNTQANGNQLKVVYHGQGKGRQVLSTWHRFKPQAGATIEGASNWIADTRLTYTRTGKVASQTLYHAADAQGNQSGKTVALTTTYGYDALNRQVWEKTPDGQVHVSVRNDPAMLLLHYDVAPASSSSPELGPVLSVVQSNILGKPVAQAVLPLDPSVQKNGKPLYSLALQAQLKALREKLQPVSTLQTLKSYGLLPLDGGQGLLAFVQAAMNANAWLTHTTTDYDGNGRRIRQVQANGAVTRWVWQAGNMVATIAPNGSIIHDTFNVQGQKVARCVQPVGSSVCHRLGTRSYDSMGNLSWQADEIGNKITYTYDADGRPLSMTTPATKADSKGHVFTYTYNSLGETGATVDGVPYVTYTYDPVTWHLTDKEDRISHLHYTYDPDTGRLLKMTRSAPTTLVPGLHYPEGTVTLDYDRYNQSVSVTDLIGNRYTAVHDRLGRVIESEVTLPGQTTKRVLTATIYDEWNRPVAITNGIRVTRTLIYNTLSQLAATTDKQGDTVLQQLSYGYDPDTGNIVTFTRSEGKDSATQSYAYDKNTNNLTAMQCSETSKSGASSALCPRDTDLNNSHLTTPPVILAQHYTFDDWNNIKTVTEQLVTASGKTTTKTQTYTYAEEQTGTALPQAYDPHRMTAFSTRWQGTGYSTAPKTLTYDRLGRVIKDADGSTLHYNAFGQQDGFTNAQTTESTHYTYDSAGHQVAEQPFDPQGQPLQQPLYMLYQGNAIVAQVQDDGAHHTHISAELGGTAHSEDGVINRWYLHDYKGDVLTTLNAVGSRTGDHIYSPYGMDYDRLSAQSQTLPAKLHLATQGPWWQSHAPGFDNQMNDPATGYQFLGGGYRAYNPIYRHFMSHDSFSPFKKIDGYGFGDNNPIMNTDPTGHMPKWASYLMGALTIGVAIVSAVLLPVAATTFSAVSAIAAASAITGGVGGAVSMASGSLQIANTAHPENRKLAIASQAFGIADGVAAMTVGLATVGAGAAGMGMIYMSKLTCTMVAFSGVTNTMSGAISSSTSSLGLAMIMDPNLAKKAGLNSLITTLNDVSMVLMGASAITGLIEIPDLLTNGKFARNKAIGMLRKQREINAERFSIIQSHQNPKGVVNGLRFISKENLVLDPESLTMMLRHEDPYSAALGLKALKNDNNGFLNMELRDYALSYQNPEAGAKSATQISAKIADGELLSEDEIAARPRASDRISAGIAVALLEQKGLMNRENRGRVIGSNMPTTEALSILRGQ